MQHLRADHNSTTNKEVDEQKAKVYRFHPNQRYLFLFQLGSSIFMQLTLEVRDQAPVG